MLKKKIKFDIFIVSFKTVKVKILCKWGKREVILLNQLECEGKRFSLSFLIISVHQFWEL